MHNNTQFQESIGSIFTSGSMEAFVIDFFATLGIDTPKDTKLLDMYREIFKNMRIFKEFLRYAQKNNFSFLENQDSQGEDRVLYLYICDFLRGITLEKIEDILQLSKPDIKQQMSRNIPGFDFTFWQALQAAIYSEIPLNSRGEVLYVVGKIGREYEVFSYESGFHTVDSQGEITGENTKNKKDKKNISERIEKYKRFLGFFSQDILEDAYDIRLAEVIMEQFALSAKIDWKKVEEDPKEWRLHLLKLRYYVL